MADPQKTEQPTQKRLKKAREEGQFPSTRQFLRGVQFCAFVAILQSQGAAWFDGLSADDRALVVKYSRDVQMDNRTFWNQYETAAVEKAKASGVQIFEIAPADKKVFQDAVKPVWDKYGAPFAGVISQIQAIS